MALVGTFALSILLLCLVMLWGVFPRGVAYAGPATAAGVAVALSLWPILGMDYFWWWLLSVVWFASAGWRLYGLDGPQRPSPPVRTHAR